MFNKKTTYEKKEKKTTKDTSKEGKIQATLRTKSKNL